MPDKHPAIIPAPSTPTSSTGKVVTVTLQPYTIATIFGTIQDASNYEQVAVVELFGKGLTVERTITLDGKKDYPYHVVGERDRFAVTWGPFTEQKKIQVVLYWTDRYSNGVEPIDDIKEWTDDKSRTKVTLISVFHHDQDNKFTLRTVVNITRMKVKG